MKHAAKTLPLGPLASAVVLAAVVTMGCAGGYEPSGGHSRLRTTGQYRQLERADEGYGASSGGQTEPTLPPDATVDDFVRIALERNPAVRAARVRIRRLEQRIPQATSLDDPMLNVAPVGRMAETAAGRARTMVGLSQRIPTPGKLDTRGRIATQEVAVARAEAERIRQEVIADVRRAYWSHYSTVRAIEVVSESRELLSEIRRAARARYEAGTAGQQDVLRASVALGNVENELTELHRRLESARAMLNQLLDRPAEANVPAPAEMPLRDLDLELSSLLAAAAKANPQLEGIRQRIEQQRAREDLARLDRWPDLTISAHYTDVSSRGKSPVADGTDQWWVGFTINLPVWFEKLDAAEREAAHARHEAEANLHAAGNRVEFELSDALFRLRSDTRQAEMLRDTIIPDAAQTVEAAAADYRAGREEFLTLLESWRRRLDLELMYHQAVVRVEHDYADLLQAVGGELPGDGPPADGSRLNRTDAPGEPGERDVPQLRPDRTSEERPE